MENLNNDQELIDFITFCKKQPEYLEYKNFVNSVTIKFHSGIYRNIFIELKKIDLEYFVIQSFSDQKNEHNNYKSCLSLFIYKKNNYVFD